MKNMLHRYKSCLAWGSIVVVLSLTLFTMTSFTALAHTQYGSATRSPLVPSIPSGRAVLVWNSQSKVLTATLYLSGLQPQSNHAAHIHAGSCSKEAPILYVFKNVVADAAGNGTSVTTIAHVTGGIPAMGWDVTVHRGSTAQTSTLLCGNVVNPQRTNSLSVPLNAFGAVH